MRVAILAALPSLEQNYSVCTVVLQQVKMLKEAGHEVHLFVKKGFNPKWGTLPEIQRLQLPGFQVQDQSAVSRDMANRFGGDVLRPYDAVFTHDFVFLDSFLGYRGGVEGIAKDEPRERLGRWFHWSHSVPRPLGEERRGFEGHTYVCLVEEQLSSVANMYRIKKSEVFPVWNPVDVTDTIDPEAGELVRELELLDTDILGVLAFPMGRMEGKGIHRAVDYYNALAENFRVKLLLCSARMDSEKQRLRKEKYKEAWLKGSSGNRLSFWFMPDVRPQWSGSTPNHIVRDLVRMSNLFIYPTIGEGNSLAIAEALTSGPLCVLPQSRVAGMKEISDQSVFLCNWQKGDWRDKTFKHPSVVAKEIEGFRLGVLGEKIHEMRRRWRFTRARIWREQLKPALEARTGKQW